MTYLDFLDGRAVLDDGTVKIYGVDTGKPLNIARQDGDLFLVHRAGYNQWAGIGMTHYERPIWVILRIKTDDLGDLMSQTLSQFESGSNWRQVRKDAECTFAALVAERDANVNVRA